MIPPWIYLAVALAIGAAGFGGGWKVRAWKAASDERAQIEQMNRDQLRRTEQASKAAAALASKQTANTARRRAADQEIAHVVTRPAYSADCFDSDGLRMLADEINRNAHTTEPDAAMPAASSASSP